MILVDANVLLDVWTADPSWHTWSSEQLRNHSVQHELAIGPVVYSEISVSFASVSQVDKKLEELGIIVLNLSREAAFIAGKAYFQYKRRGGIRSNVLADFLVGGQASALGCALLTRDTRVYKLYFPGVQLISP
jgi:predicted nucleic acid-binding protein